MNSISGRAPSRSAGAHVGTSRLGQGTTAPSTLVEVSATKDAADGA